MSEIFKSLQEAINEALELDHLSDVEVPVAHRIHDRSRTHIGYGIRVAPRLQLQPRYYSNYRLGYKPASKDEAPHGGPCLIQREPQNYKDPSLQAPPVAAKLLIDAALSADPDSIPIVRWNHETRSYYLARLKLTKIKQ